MAVGVPGQVLLDKAHTGQSQSFPFLEEEEVDQKGHEQLSLSDGSILEDEKVLFYN